MDKLKTVLTFMLGGSLIGAVVASLVAPMVLAWWNSAPLANQTMCDLPSAIHETTSALIKAQLVGAGVGAVAFMVLGILFVRSRTRKQKAAEQPPTTPPTPTTPTATST
jgi:uncharacterized membrane protein YjgN (DUF898 family)